ncbi:hypothetical protein INQ51_04295 [Maribellus sp. CM-23]|uniref:hypothetical protein n=1 Tax=Maribellus sp. CM-23 TaxID=2781026 RepID=UPI001F2D08BA|nr:hypothetical protein [Maribellus sp. CM-23]MCE4563520.1 hypothetical protein [Maribellus sp. CM-23]
MNTPISLSSRFNFTDKRYMASRVACIAFMIVFGLYLWGGRSLAASAISVTAILLFVLQFVLQFNAVNGVLGGLMVLVGLYFSMAVWSEFSEFEVVNKEALTLLFVGWGLCLSVIVLAIFMVVSFIRDFTV